MAEISMQKSSLRIEWIDICKGLGIFLVVIGHTSIAQISQTVYNWIYSFHMPMFYMLSGMVDTLMLSSVSDQAVGAVGTANT